MAKFKNIRNGAISFDYNGKEKILLPGKSYELETNSYLEALTAQGYLATTEEAVEEAEKEAETEPEKPKK